MSNKYLEKMAMGVNKDSLVRAHLLNDKQEIQKQERSYKNRLTIHNGLSGAELGGIVGAVFSPKGRRLKGSVLGAVAGGTGAAIKGYLNGPSHVKAIGEAVDKVRDDSLNKIKQHLVDAGATVSMTKKAGFLSTGLKNAAREVGHASPASKDELLSRIASKGFNGKRAYINGVRTEVGKSLSTGTSHGSAFKQALMKVK